MNCKNSVCNEVVDCRQCKYYIAPQNENTYAGIDSKHSTQEELMELAVSIYKPAKEDICFDIPTIINGAFRIDTPLYWANIKIKYKDVIYNIEDGQSDKYFVYWDSKEPNKFKDSDIGYVKRGKMFIGLDTNFNKKNHINNWIFSFNKNVFKEPINDCKQLI